MTFTQKNSPAQLACRAAGISDFTIALSCIYLLVHFTSRNARGCRAPQEERSCDAEPIVQSDLRCFA